MWIQVRTIDGSQTRTIEDVSRKATIEELRERVWALFDVRPECQRLFYRGKQCVCFAHVMSLYHLHARLLKRLEEDFRASDFLELELEIAVNHYVGAGNLCGSLEKQPVLLTTEPSLQLDMLFDEACIVGSCILHTGLRSLTQNVNS